MSTRGTSKPSRITSSGCWPSDSGSLCRTTRTSTCCDREFDSARRCDLALSGACSACAESDQMSTSCKGKVIWEGPCWYCLDCGCSSSTWATQHAPLQTRARHFQASLNELAKEAYGDANVGAAATAP